MKCPNCNSDIKVTFLSASILDNIYCRSCKKYATTERKFLIYFYLVFVAVFYGVNSFFHNVFEVSLELPKETFPFFIIPQTGPETFLILISLCTLIITHIFCFFLFRVVAKLRIREGGHLRSSTVSFFISIFVIIFIVQLFSYLCRGHFS